MPKYKFNCYESRTLTLVVEAPSLEAAEKAYREADEEKFHGYDTELEWGFDSITRTDEGYDLGDADYVVDENGKTSVAGEEAT